MFESLIGLVALIALVVIVARQHSRMGMLEREVGALRSFVLTMPQVAPAQPESARASAASPVAEVQVAALPASPAAERLRDAAPEAPAETFTERADAPFARAEPLVAEARQPEPVPYAAGQLPPESPPRPDFVTTLGTKWAVWVGGLALALGGLFLIRYTIEAGIFGPAVRLSLAGLFGLALVAAGEFIRRTGFKMPIEGAASAYVPGIVTAAGAFTLFGTVYAAHSVYGFIGPGLAFALLGVIAVGTIAAALVHGQALAGLGLLGSMITPLLVSSESPNPWALFGYLAVVLVANTAIARLRSWVFPAAAGFAGVGLWNLVYMAGFGDVDLAVVLFINAVSLLSLAFVWLASRADEPESLAVDWPSVMPAIFVGISGLMLLADPVFFQRGEVYGMALIAALVAVALYRPAALPLVWSAGIATVVAHLRFAFGGTFTVGMLGDQLTVEGLPPSPYSATSVWIGAALAAILLAAGFYGGRRFAASSPLRAASWVGWGSLVPVVAVGSLWIAFGNLDVDFGYAAAALAVTLLLAAGGEMVARSEAPPLTGGLAVTFALCGAGAALVLALHMAFGPLWTTMACGLAAVLPAIATRQRLYPVLGWLSVGAVIVVLGRVAFDPTIVGALFLGKTPVFNALLPGYGVPALAFAFAAWQLARTTNGQPRLAMEASAALFALLTVAMLVRHAMHGGVIDQGALTLAEQAIYTLIALGAGGILLALDLRSPSPVLRIGSMAAGVFSVICTVGQHFLYLNPLFTDEPTGKIPVFNLLFLAYLLPAIAAAALALYARAKRPPWYSAMLGLLAAVLAFAYATLSVRRLFQGENIGLWAGMSQMETYSYSALWLAMGVALLLAGVWQKSQVLRLASAVLIAVAVAKVFIFDMSELQGVLRALSFIGLGAVLIGIGLFYQRLLTRSAKAAPTG